MIETGYNPLENQLPATHDSQESEQTSDRLIEFVTPNEDLSITRHESLVNPTAVEQFKINYDSDPQQTLEDFKAGLVESYQRFIKKHDLSLAEANTVLEALMKIPDEVRAGFTPKAAINFQTGETFSEYFPVTKALAGLGLRPDASGVSVNIQTADGDIVTVRRRSGGNNSCQGFFAPAAAGYINDNPNAETIEQLITSEIYQQLHHEIGINPREVTINIGDVVTVDYPSNQSELLVSAEITLTKEQLLARVGNLEDEGPDKLAEKEIFFLPADKLLKILRDPECRVATQHALALALPFRDTPVWPEAVEAIQKLPTYPVGEVWQDMPAFLQKHGISWS
jgi:hypothetical protein